MSHIVEIKTEIKDGQAVRAACERLKLEPPENATTKVFNATATGLCVYRPRWAYPVVCDLKTGQIQYDNYGGHWGDQKRLDAFLQGYAFEKTKIEARKKGYSCSETRLTDGRVGPLERSPTRLFRLVYNWK